MTFIKIFLFLSTIFCYNTALAQCNLHESLCSKRYNKVAYLTTHNAFNATDADYILPNQTKTLTGQLEDGVRALMLDVYYLEEIPTVYHSFAAFGNEPLHDNLIEIKRFLEANQNEIVTIIFECYIEAKDIEQSIIQSGLTSYLFTKPENEWPTLAEMIDQNQRLVIFTDRNDAGPDQGWYHYVWDHAVETHFSNNSISDFSCEFNRGNAENDLFILNHFLTSVNYGTGQPQQAEIINQNPYLLDRALECQEETGKFPNFITIDFHEIGDCKVMVDQLNGIESVANENLASSTSLIKLYPNPSADVVTVEIPRVFTNGIVKLYDASMRELFLDTKLNFQTKLNMSHFQNGMYFIKIEGEGFSEIKKFIKNK